MPWWAFSPSPFSLIFYAILIAYATAKMLKRNTYRRTGIWKVIVAFTDGFFALAFLVLLTDLLWIVGSGLRFGGMYPESVLQLVLCAFRNIFGLIGVNYITSKFFDYGLLNVTKWTTILFYVNVLYLVLWFTLSPSPAYTDWTFAIKYDYPLQIIVQSFLTSHIVGRVILALMFYSLFQ